LKLRRDHVRDAERLVTLIERKPQPGDDEAELTADEGARTRVAGVGVAGFADVTGDVQEDTEGHDGDEDGGDGDGDGGAEVAVGPAEVVA